MYGARTSRPYVLAGVGLIFLVRLIHLVDAPGSMAESTLKGLSFYANFAGAALAAFGIFGIPPDTWLEPIGIASLIVEGLFVALFLKVAFARNSARNSVNNVDSSPARVR